MRRFFSRICRTTINLSFGPFFYFCLFVVLYPSLMTGLFWPFRSGHHTGSFFLQRPSDFSSLSRLQVRGSTLFTTPRACALEGYLRPFLFFPYPMLNRRHSHSFFRMEARLDRRPGKFFVCIFPGLGLVLLFHWVILLPSFFFRSLHRAIPVIFMTSRVDALPRSQFWRAISIVFLLLADIGDSLPFTVPYAQVEFLRQHQEPLEIRYAFSLSFSACCGQN